MAIKGNLLGRLEQTIEDMGVGQKGYTLPWALSIERRGTVYELYLNLTYPVKQEIGGTIQLYIERTGGGRCDYEIDLRTVGEDFKWNIGKAHYVGCDESDIVKIGEIRMLDGLAVK